HSPMDSRPRYLDVLCGPELRRLRYLLGCRQENPHCRDLDRRNCSPPCFRYLRSDRRRGIRKHRRLELSGRYPYVLRHRSSPCWRHAARSVEIFNCIQEFSSDLRNWPCIFLLRPSTITPTAEMNSNPNTVFIAVGSTRKPKLGAVRDAVASL